MKGHQGCPFCGNSAAVDTLKYAGGKPAHFRAQCQGCRASTGWYGTEEEAWKAWDARHGKRGKAGGNRGKKR